MDLNIGDFYGLIDVPVTSGLSNGNSKEAVTAKICEKEFLRDSKSTDEDEIKFQADFHFFKKEFKRALILYLKLLTGQRYGSSRSLLAEVYESLAVCYNRLELTEDALQYSAKSEEVGKSADHRNTNLFIKTRILLSTADKDGLLAKMKRLLILHPYNHLLWLEFALLHTESQARAVYLLRTSLLLEINSRTVESFIAEKQQAMCLQVKEEVDTLTVQLGLDTIARIKRLVKERDVAERYIDEWQNVEYRITVLNSSAEEVVAKFHKKWDILLNDVG